MIQVSKNRLKSQEPWNVLRSFWPNLTYPQFDVMGDKYQQRFLDNSLVLSTFFYRFKKNKTSWKPFSRRKLQWDWSNTSHSAPASQLVSQLTHAGGFRPSLLGHYLFPMHQNCGDVRSYRAGKLLGNGSSAPHCQPVIIGVTFLVPT